MYVVAKSDCQIDQMDIFTYRRRQIFYEWIDNTLWINLH